MRALLGHSDPQARDQIAGALRQAGYEVLAVGDGLRAVQYWQVFKPDIVLLGFRLPVFDADAVCQRIRQEALTPVLVLNSHASEKEIVAALTSGADAYVPEPKRTSLLLAHMQAALRRGRCSSQPEQANEVRLGDLVLDSSTYTVTRRGSTVQLTRLEFRILDLLVRNADRLVPYLQLISHVWGYVGEARPDVLKTHIYHLRKKLDLAEELRATPGVGYRLVSSARQSPCPSVTEPPLGSRPVTRTLGSASPVRTVEIADTFTRDPHWVVLKTRPWRERQAEQAIAAGGIETYVPLLSADEHDGAAMPLFPGYLLARVDLSVGDLLRIRSAAGVAYILPHGGPPLALPDDLIEAIRTRVSTSERGLRQGDRVKIMRGPFQWLEAVFDRRSNPAGRVRILLEFVQRTVAIDMDERDLRYAGRALASSMTPSDGATWGGAATPRARTRAPVRQAPSTPAEPRRRLRRSAST
jgi:DNA-binding response OmpR family regulator/transcription antitermination factor NusG